MNRPRHIKHKAAPEPTRPVDSLPMVSRRAARIALVALHAAALIAVLMEMTFPLSKDGHGVERHQVLDFAGSYAIYGFVACVALVLLGRVLRRAVIRDEHYYDGGT